MSNEHVMYEGAYQPDAEDKLLALANLAKVGVAALDSVKSIEHLDCALETLFEAMYRLAMEGADEAETIKRGTRNTIKHTKDELEAAE